MMCFFCGLEGRGKCVKFIQNHIRGEDGVSTGLGGIALRGRQFNSNCLEYFHVVKEVSVVSDTGYMSGDLSHGYNLEGCSGNCDKQVSAGMRILEQNLIASRDPIIS